jgi:hypothetical protein
MPVSLSMADIIVCLRSTGIVVSLLEMKYTPSALHP